MKLNSKNRSRKGFSILEAVIAIAVISIITVAAITMVTQSIKVERNNIRDAEIKTYSENAIECFRFANDREEFFSLIKKTASFVDENEDGTLGENERIELKKSDYTIAITVDLLYNNMMITAINSSGTEIFSLDYSIGGIRL